MLEHNPALELGKIVVKSKQVVPFTDDEMAAIETAAKARIADKIVLIKSVTVANKHMH